MTFSTRTIPLLQTKLCRPPVPQNTVCRTVLHERLDAASDLPLTLVSAPAGYGKSTLISNWLQSCDVKSAWVSLDENDNDLRVFLGYLVAAIRDVSPQACQSILLPLRSDDLPSTHDLVRLLGNDLQALDERFILALDDYHLIHNPAIHELVDELLRHPPRSLHLAVITRRDPPLSLRTLRGRSKVTEIRVAELQFHEYETEVLLNRVTRQALDHEVVATLHSTTEGWPLGLQIAAAALSRDQRSETPETLAALAGQFHEIQEYLVGELIAAHPPQVVECLCRLSIVQRFCVSLSRALCGGQQESLPLAGSAGDTGIMCIHLDAEGGWHRFHHLFQNALRRRLERHASSAEIKALHLCASNWFHEEGLLDEAMHHALKAGDAARAADMIASCRHTLINNEQWADLHHRLSLLPFTVPQESPELLVATAWSRQRRGQYADIPALLDRAETALKDREPKGCSSSPVYGEVQALRSFLFYGMSDADLARSAAEEAVAGLSPTHGAVWAFAVLMRSVTIQACGDVNKARELLHVARRTVGDTAGAEALLLSGLCVVEWVAGDLASLVPVATQYLDLGQKHALAESISLGSYYLGVSAYLRNDLSAVDSWLTDKVNQRQITHDVYFAHCAFATALSHLAQGRDEEAFRVSAMVTERALELGAVPLLGLAKAFEAELDLRQGLMAKAVAWSTDFNPDSPPAAFRFYVPHLTFAKMLIGQNTDESRQHAGALLDRLQELFAVTHNIRVLTDVLALRALLWHKDGDESAALASLAQSVSLGQLGGVIRPFVDMGFSLARLLNRLDLDEEGIQYVGQILAVFKGDGQGEAPQGTQPTVSSANVGPAGLPEPISRREREVLDLLAGHLTNKEIGERLFISTGTVKRHTHSIYEKLAVGSRRAAVAKARGLGLLK